MEVNWRESGLWIGALEKGVLSEQEMGGERCNK